MARLVEYDATGEPLYQVEPGDEPVTCLRCWETLPDGFIYGRRRGWVVVVAKAGTGSGPRGMRQVEREHKVCLLCLRRQHAIEHPGEYFDEDERVDVSREAWLETEGVDRGRAVGAHRGGRERCAVGAE